MLKQIITYASTTAISKIFNWILFWTLPLILTPNNYGIIGLIAAVEGIGGGLLLFGQDRAMMRYTPHESNKDEFGATIFKTWGSIATLLILVAIIIFYILKDQSKTFNFFPDILLIAAILLSINFNTLIITRYRIQNNTKKYSQTIISLFSLKLGLILLFTYLLANYLGYLIGYLISLFIINLFSIPLISKYLTIKINIEFVKKVISFGWPLVFQVIGGTSLVFFDRFLIIHFVDDKSLGYYTLAYSIGASITFGHAILNIYFEPNIYKLANNRTKAYELLIIFNSTTTIIFCLLSSIVLFITKYYFMDIYGIDYMITLQLIPIIILAHLLTPIYNLGYYYFNIGEKTKILATITILLSLLNILLNIILIPSYKIFGAAYSTFICYTVLSIVILITIIKKGFTHPERNNMLLIFIITLGILLTALFLNNITFTILTLNLIMLINVFYLHRFKYILLSMLKGNK